MLARFDRRHFLQTAAGAAVAAQLPWELALAGEDDLLALVDPRLRPRPASVRPDQNAWPLLRDAAKKLSAMPDTEDELEDCFDADKPNAQRDQVFSAWLDANEHLFAAVEGAVAKGKVELPRGPWDDERLDDSTRLRNVARWLQLRAQRLAHQGQLVAAAETALVSLEFSRLYQRGGGFLVDYLIATACHNAGIELIRRLAERSDCDAKTLRALLARLPERKDERRALQAAVQAEFAYYLFPYLVKTKGLDTKALLESTIEWEEKSIFLSREKYESLVEKIGRMLAGHPRAYDLVGTVREANRYYVRLLDSLPLSWSEFSKRADDAPNAELSPWPAQLAPSLLHAGDPDEVTDEQLSAARNAMRKVDNPLGKKLLESSEMAAYSMLQAALANQARYDGLRLFLALALFHREQERFPERLDELVTANLLPGLPNDPFTGRAFQYSADRLALWSLGPDGQITPETSEEDDYMIASYLWKLDVVARGK